MQDLLDRAKADPVAFRRETVEALKKAGYTGRALGVAGEDEFMIPEGMLRADWFPMRTKDPSMKALESNAKAHNDALLQALDEMSPAEREKLGW